MTEPGGFEPVDGKSLVRQVREPSSLKTDHPSSHATSDRESFATGRDRPAVLPKLKVPMAAFYSEERRISVLGGGDDSSLRSYHDDGANKD